VTKAGSYAFKDLKGDFSDDEIREQANNKLLPYLKDQKKLEKPEIDPFETQKRSTEEFIKYFEEQGNMSLKMISQNFQKMIRQNTSNKLTTSYLLLLPN